VARVFDRDLDALADDPLEPGSAVVLTVGVAVE
jgi:hypothetical protein